MHVNNVLYRPLINVCDRHDMVGDLTHYLFSNNMLRYIEGYVQKVNPSKAPQVVGGLLDAEASDEFINNLILSVRSLIPVEQLCLEVRITFRSLMPPSRMCTSGSAHPDKSELVCSLKDHQISPICRSKEQSL